MEKGVPQGHRRQVGIKGLAIGPSVSSIPLVLVVPSVFLGLFDCWIRHSKLANIGSKTIKGMRVRGKPINKLQSKKRKGAINESISESLSVFLPLAQFLSLVQEWRKWLGAFLQALEISRSEVYSSGSTCLPCPLIWSRISNLFSLAIICWSSLSFNLMVTGIIKMMGQWGSK